MQALTTSDYRGGFQWPQAQEDEEDSYPLYVPYSSPFSLSVDVRLQPASNEGPFPWVIYHIWRQHPWWWAIQVPE
jgi:hypothetical protein